MIIEKDSYLQLIEYLTDNLALFESPTDKMQVGSTIMEVIEAELAEQIILLCQQNNQLTFNQRNQLIREVDAILDDLQEVLISVINNQATEDQVVFIKEFALLIKNIFDNEIHQMLHIDC
jgi:hypothetical protein